MDRLVADQPLIAHLDPQGIKENQRIDCFQGAGLPRCDLLQHRVGDRADQIRRDLDTVEIAQMADDLTCAHAPGVHRNDLSSNPGKRRWYLAISCGSKRAWRSRGTSSSICPVSVMTVFLP